jgi:hypothetical protein
MARRRALLIAALGFLQLREQPPGVALLRRWMDSWAGLGAVLDGIVKQGSDVALSRNGDAGWRALLFSIQFHIHESRSGAAWRTTPWQAVQRAAWETLRRAGPWVERPKKGANRAAVKSGTM